MKVRRSGEFFQCKAITSLLTSVTLFLLSLIVRYRHMVVTTTKQPKCPSTCFWYNSKWQRWFPVGCFWHNTYTLLLFIYFWYFSHFYNNKDSLLYNQMYVMLFIKNIISNGSQREDFTFGLTSPSEIPNGQSLKNKRHLGQFSSELYVATTTL